MVAAAVIAPSVVTALAVVAIVPSRTMGKWLESIFKKREVNLKGKNVITSLLCIGTIIKKMDFDKVLD